MEKTMVKRFISVCIAAILVCAFCGCAHKAGDAPATEQNLIASDHWEKGHGETGSAGAEMGSGEQAAPIYIIQPQLTQDNSYEMQDWQAAYAGYIEGLEWAEGRTYSLIYVDDDNIPELVIDTGVEAGGCQILTYHNREIDELQTNRLQFYYIEKKNLLNNTGGVYGQYFDCIYSIENGKWVRVADGEWTMTMKDGDWVYRYEWDGEEVKEDAYTQSLNAAFDMKQKAEPELYYIMDEILALLRTGNVASQNHRYELFVEDVTWDEARSRCEERGGYLATITSVEEYERIQKGIADSGLTDTAFWVGACDNEDVLGQEVQGFGWLEPDKDPADYGMLGHYNALFIFWGPDEPSYRVETDGKTIWEDFVYFMYDDAQGRCCLYDAPMDLLSVYPECEGKIGYICEYDPIAAYSKDAV